MAITLRRLIETTHGTFGRLEVDVERAWYAVEPRADAEYPRIPAGTYPLSLDRYHKGGYPAYEIEVPGRSRILIHAANLASELWGCVAPGNYLGFLGDQLAVIGSRSALKGFMAAMRGLSQDRIIVLDPPTP